MGDLFVSIGEWLQRMQDKFILDFIVDNRWRYLMTGLENTLIVTFFAAIMGIVLGFAVATVRSAYDLNDIKNAPRTWSNISIRLLNTVCKLYLTVIRGTPVVVQLMIIYFLILGPFGWNDLTCAIIGFGINSGAYVAEIVRGGIMSIDRGQMEAGRSLGFSFSKTMLLIIFPQAFKTVLPSLANEFIVLLKETSVAGYVALHDLTKGGDIIRGRTYDAFFPLVVVALIYLIMVVILEKLVSRLERRLRQSER